MGTHVASGGSEMQLEPVVAVETTEQPVSEANPSTNSFSPETQSMVLQAQAEVNKMSVPEPVIKTEMVTPVLTTSTETSQVASAPVQAQAAPAAAFETPVSAPAPVAATMETTAPVQAQAAPAAAFETPVSAPAPVSV